MERRGRGWFAASLLLRPLHLGIEFVSFLYLAALTTFLFRPPDLDLYNIDRIAFGVLVFFVVLRTLAMRDCIPFVPGLSLPMLGLVALATFRTLREPFDAQTWSLVASKFVVPFVLLHLGMLVFRGASQRRHFEVFVIVALAYLALTAVAFLVGARDLIFPRFILDDSLGVQAERARGPFLQAVANGVSLNILGILAITLARRHRTVVLLLWLVLPLAILATMTRAVWIAFAVSTVFLAIRLREPCLRRACIGVAVVGVLAALVIGLSDSSLNNALQGRTAERGPVEARMAVYDAGWEMFQERPLTGWTAGGMYTELARRMQGYHLRVYYVHNTYLSLLLEFGIPGLALYGILFRNLFRLGRARAGTSEDQAIRSLRKAWPILLSVYLFNALFVDMGYQFVGGLLFTVAGILCSQGEAAV